MINTSNEYKQVISGGSRTMYASEICTLASGESIDIPQAKLRGLLIEDDVSGKNSFDLGAVIINQCTIKLDNTDGVYSEKEFDQAKIAVKIGLQLSETAEWLNKGTFTAEPGTESGDVITIKAYDNMKKFDFPYSDSKLAYPATLRQIVQDACDLCGVSLASSLAATEFDYAVNERPSDDALTFREALHWVGEIACCWFRCNANGAMEAGFYDLAAYEDETEGSFHEIKNLTALTKATEDIIITGIRVEQESDDGDVVYQAGEDGYMLSVQGNQLINVGDAGQVATSLGNKLIGLRFRKLSVSHQSDPSIEAGDLAKVTDRKGNAYKTLLTSTAFQLGGIQKSACNAKNPSLNGATRFSESTKAYIKLRKLLRDEKTARETAVENLANTIANKNGLYMTTEEMEDGSLIYYAHNKPTIEESDIIWLMTAEAIGISTDGGETYPYGFVVDGELITRILQTEGINADWINAGALVVKDSDGNIVFSINVETGEVLINIGSVMTNDGTKLEDNLELLRQEITNTYTRATQTANEIIMEAVKEYTKTSDFETFKETMNTLFEQNSEEFVMSFNRLQEQITNVDGDMQSEFAEIKKYIRFVDGSIVLGEEGNQIVLTIENDRISFAQNGIEVCYISNAKMGIREVEITKRATIVGLSFYYASNGSICIN